MASTYTRPRSPFIWLRYKDENGRWKGKPTGYRKGNTRDVAAAERLARKQTEIERARAPRGSSEEFGAWVPQWLDEKYGGREATTRSVYGRYWKHLDFWLSGEGIRTPGQFFYRHIPEYRAARMANGSSCNAVLQELKFMGVIMGEAVRRGFAQANPCVRMGLKKERPKEKAAWTDGEIRAVQEAIHAAPHWMQCTFWLGLYQAARLRQCAVPMRDIDLKRRRITYRKTKGDKPFSQPLDERIIKPLSALMASRPSDGLLCDFPPLPSVEWREFLDVLGLHHLVHHGLRVTWVTRAALSGKVSLSLAKAFVNHGSSAVHAIYQRLNSDDLAHVPAAIDLPS